MDTLGERAAAWIRQVRSLFRRRFDDELADEMRMHLELRRQVLIDRGMDPRDAEYEARRLFGNPTVLRERSRDAWGFASVASFWRDLGFGARLLLRHPAQSGAIVLTIALGGGLNAALFLGLRASGLEPSTSSFPHFRRYTSDFTLSSRTSQSCPTHRRSNARRRRRQVRCR